MRIAIPALTVNNRSGTGTYTRELVRHLVPKYPEHEWIIFYPEGYRGFDSIINSPTSTFVPVSSLSSLQRIWWEQMKFPQELVEHGVDGFHAPAFIAPFAYPCPYVMTLHDWAWMKYSRYFPLMRRYYYRWFIPATIRNARAIITDTEAVALENPQFRDKTIPIHLGPNPYVKRGPYPEELTQLRRKYKLPVRFLLALGTMEPRKNLQFLIQVFVELRKRNYPLSLVLTGRFGWGELNLPGETKFHESILTPGFIPEEDLPALYALAETVVYPSLYEGFGLPVLDAMTSGKPIVISSDPALLEVTDGCALAKDPDHLEGWMHTLELLANSPELREELGKKALIASKKYSWQETARKTMEVYEKYLS